MDDLNDLYFFTAVVQFKGFSAAARATGVEKTRLSRRVAGLEKRLGVRLLHRSTRTMSLTEAGERFYEHCLAVVEGANAAYDSLHALKKEPSGSVRLSCPVVVAQSYLVQLLPAYMAAHPKVSVYLEATDRPVNLVEEGFDIMLRSLPAIENSADLVARELGSARRILVASPAFLDLHGRPQVPEDLVKTAVIGDVNEREVRWTLENAESRESEVKLSPKLVSHDRRVQLEASLHGIGIALLPEPIVASLLRDNRLERVLPDWSTCRQIIHLVYPRPRGMLPSVRSLIDFLMVHIPPSIKERSVQPSLCQSQGSPV